MREQQSERRLSPDSSGADATDRCTGGGKILKAHLSAISGQRDAVGIRRMRSTDGILRCSGDEALDPVVRYVA